MAGTAKLTAKQALFVREYLVDLNATQAAIRAGYSKKTAEQQGYQLLQKTSVAEAIAKASEKRAAKLEITAERVLAEYAKIGFADLRKIATWRKNSDVVLTNQDGEVVVCPDNVVDLVPADELDDDTAAALSEVSVSKDGTLKVKLHDKKGALDSIARHLGMFVDRVAGADGGPLEVVIRKYAADSSAE